MNIIDSDERFWKKLCLFMGLLTLIPTIKAQQVTLLFAGDAMQHQAQLDNACREGSYDYSTYFQHLTEAVSCADIAVVNLETTLGGKPYKGYPMFSSPDEYAIALKDAGFDVFLNANNHILDRFSRGLHRTLDVLDSLNVKHTGVFRNLEEREKTYPLLMEANDIRIAFLNYTYGTNGMKPAFPDIVNYINPLHIRQDIQRAKFLKADIIIANMHWGTEYQLRQSWEQEKTARFLIEEGVDIVMGSHPHVVQPAQVITDSTGRISNVIVYSLGNFVSGMTAVNTDGGQLIRIVLEKQPEKPRIVSCHYILVYVDRKQNENKTDYSVVPVLPEANTANSMKMQRFAGNARDVLNKYNTGVAEDSLFCSHRLDLQERFFILPWLFK
ncbi:capsular polysaccharide biosynthesis protein [Bacteroidia bacterium]|nr:capsular polysaccharide biosynthesis protein [Bacteroidia bacterium]